MAKPIPFPAKRFTWLRWIGIACGLIVVSVVSTYSIRQQNNHYPQEGVRHTIGNVRPQSVSPPAPSVVPATQTYIAIGKIPVEGLPGGATFYGALATPENGHYLLSNFIQGGMKNGGAYDGYDDNGEGACGGKYTKLSNQATWAEDDNGTILGNLPCGTKLEISYRGHMVIAEKGDTSNGGCTAPATRCSDNGFERKIDLWWQTAKALCFSEQPDAMTIHAVPENTPTTAIPSYDKNDPLSTATCN